MIYFLFPLPELHLGPFHLLSLFLRGRIALDLYSPIPPLNSRHLLKGSAPSILVAFSCSWKGSISVQKCCL